MRTMLSKDSRCCLPSYPEILSGTVVFVQRMVLFVAAVVLLASVANGQNIKAKTQSGPAIELYNDYHALVIGVQHYDHWPDRAGGVQDVRDVSQQLRRLGFRVTLLTDPAADELSLAFEQFVQKIGVEREQAVVFYYAGHSRTLAEPNGERTGYIIPKDTPRPEENRRGFMAKTISTEDIKSMARKIKPRHVLFLFDTPLCIDQFEVETMVLKCVRATDGARTRQFITAGGAGETASEIGIFKKFLLRGLDGEADLIVDDLVSGSELGLYLSQRIAAVTDGRLRPQFGRITGGGSETGGDFIFRMNNQPLRSARLFVDVAPEAARIQIVNINPRFEQGMELEPGKYDLHVSAEGYSTVKTSIRLAAGEDRTVAIKLVKTAEEITNSIGMRFMRIPTGSFLMGSPDDEVGRLNDIDGNEVRHRVKLTRPFYMQATEATVGQFRRFVTSSGYKTDAEKNDGCWIAGRRNTWLPKKGSSWENPGTVSLDDELPVICVSWNDAAAFARWLSQKEGRTYRLPTEAQWEYAARAGTTTPFSTGQCLSTSQANYAGIGRNYTHCASGFHENRGRLVKAGLLEPNTFKLYNMHGNVSEWCLDWYDGPYPEDVADPTGPDFGDERVMRGGHWKADVHECRLAKRNHLWPHIASDVVGFRLVLLP